MNNEELSTSVSRPVSAHPVVTDDPLPCIIIFVAGERSCVETALRTARRLYPDRRFVFVCEPVHRSWIAEASSDRVFVVEQPFNPFGRRASELRRSLESTPIEACALVIADVGFESFRFRIYALRLRTQRFLLLGGDKPDGSKQLNRFSFALLAGAAPFLVRLRKIERRTLVFLGRIVAWFREPRDRMPRAYRFIRGRILRTYDRSIGAWLRDLREEVSSLTEEALRQAVEVQRLSGTKRADGTDNIKHKFKCAAASLGIRQLDKRYRRFFKGLFISEPWQKWFGSRNFSNESLTLVIGTLGPGGSERQVVATLLGLASRDYCDLALLSNRLVAPVDRFYAHLLKGSPVSVYEVSEDFRCTDGAEGIEARASAGLRVLAEKLPSELKDLAWYARKLLARRPWVVHTWLDYNNAKAGLAAALIGVPRIVLSTRSVAPTNFVFFQPYMREAYRALAARPNVCLLNNSEAGARDYERWLGLPRGTFKVIRNGFDFSELEPAEKREEAREFRTRLGIPPEVPLVGSVLRFSEEKCPLLWIDVASRVAERRPDVMFLMVGDGPLRKDACQRAAACGIGDRIVMPGNEKDAAVAIAAMDVFLLTSRLEGFPNVLIEAQALGVPVITTDAGGAAETLIQGRTGYAIFPHSADLLADAVLQVLGDRAWREAARPLAQRFVRERFSMSKMVDRTLDAYFARGEFAQSSVKHNEIGHLSEAISLGDQMAPAEKRFEFGKNWKKYIEKSFNQEKVEASKARLRAFLNRDDLQGLAFLDIGCGSGLHSLGALQLGAAEVISFDYDAKSVEATSILYKYAGEPRNWKIMQGSVLDEQFMASLPKSDIVYSWGVLHHTGDVWRAISNAAVPVKKEGLFYIALYSADVQKNPTPEFWLDVKRRYLAASILEKRKMEWWYVWRFQMGYKISALPKVLRYIIEHKKNRGMSYFTDIRDWLGGWPMEFCYDDDVKKFVINELGMKLVNIKAGEANTEFLFKKP